MSPVTAPRSRRCRTAGQSLAEFALVTPILLMLVVIVADFGRVFAANLAIEAAARDAAEAVANQYLAAPPGGSLSVPASGSTTYYAPLHALAARTVCSETSDLANTSFDSGTGLCPGMPLIQVCIHDSQDTECAAEAQGSGIPSNCDAMATPPMNGHAGSNTPRWTEVRICYKFTPILADMPFLSFATIWLQRTRTFVIPCYWALGESECG